ncbi:MAG: DUF494 family protein [Candidatus Eisenbacteria bacterium]|nr:DUF494 family protein [Candidatus Eisenbacteria bacterium]
MSDEPANQKVSKLLRLLAERLEGYLEGDELAFETLGEALDEAAFSGDDLQAAMWMLRGLGDLGGSAQELEAPPGKHAQRVLSAEERTSLSPEAWGYLLELQRHGSLDAEQVERVLDLLTESGVRPVGVDLAREVAMRVALQSDRASDGESPHGDIDLIH